MNEMMAGMPIDMIKTYGTTLMVIFIAFFYFTGMPVLVIFTFIHLFLTYFIEKHLIINHYSKCDVIDERVNNSNSN